MMDQVEYIKSNKGGIKIIYKGYMYTVHKNKKCGGIRWRCAQRSLNCKGSISTNLSGYPHINMPHNHLPDHQSIAIARTKFEDNLEGHLISNFLSLAAKAVLSDVWEPLTPLKDSMPLEQRLKTPPEQEPILQSQPLSPTKLKVTRQSTKPPQPSPKPATPEPPNEEVCLRWNSHHSNMQSSFPNLLMKEQYVDATLVAEGQSLKCHRLILSSCSPYFEEVLSGISPFQHPVLFMKDIPFWVLKSLCDFMYAGEVHIFQNKLEELLAVAEILKIKGLAGKMDGSNEEVKNTEPAKAVKEERKEEKEVKEKKRNSQFYESTPRTNSKTIKSVYPSKKFERVSKEPLSKEGILDPLDLLEPVYEEVTRESALPKMREIRNIPMKKGRLKKRKFSEEREESPPPLFLSRKGTRSRPNVKIPKYYHTHYERISESTIVREPHTEQPDPLFQLEDIKSEPLDLDDDVIEIEDNVIGFTEVPDLPPHDEEIIGNYDSPLVNLNDKTGKEEEHTPFKKINLVAQPIIMNVHSVTEKSADTLRIVDVVHVEETVGKNDDPLGAITDVEGSKGIEDPLNFVNEVTGKEAGGITITNVQSMAEMEEVEEKRDDATQEQQIETLDEVPSEPNCVFHIENVVSEKEDTCEAEKSDASPKHHFDIVENEISSQEVVDAVEVEIPVGDTKESNESIAVDVPTVFNETRVVCLINEKEALHMETEAEEIVDGSKVKSSLVTETATESGFHIEKVRSEEDFIPDVKDVISENCASELGFEITDIASGQIDGSDQVISEDNAIDDAGGGDKGTFPNHLEEIETATLEKRDDEADGKSTPPVEAESLSEETRCLAESLEKLLDK